MRHRFPDSIAIPSTVAALTMLVVVACGEADGPSTRLETRVSISGQVILEAVPGLDDFTRVRVDVGRGEGGVAPDAQGRFSFTDLEPDVYELSVSYAGSFVLFTDVPVDRYRISVERAGHASCGAEVVVSHEKQAVEAEASVSPDRVRFEPAQGAGVNTVGDRWYVAPASEADGEATVDVSVVVVVGIASVAQAVAVEVRTVVRRIDGAVGAAVTCIVVAVAADIRIE